jgi:hypothetical protein
LMVTAAYYLAVHYSDSLPAIHGAHSAWRYTLISGVIPAVPLIVIRPFLPESPMWAQKKAAGTLKRPRISELFAPQFRRTTIVTAIMFACSYGAAFGAIQHIPRIVPGLAEVSSLARPLQEKAVSSAQFFQEIGGLLGRFALALLAVRIVSRRKLLWVFQVPGVIIVPLVFFYAATHSLDLLRWGMLMAGFVTVAQFSFWGNYLPRVYPTYLRGTGESFAANVGGRMVGTSAAFVTTQLANVAPGGSASIKLAYSAAAVAAFVYILGFLMSFRLPEPQRDTIPE